MALHKEAERLRRELGNQEGLAISLANRALHLSRMPARRGEARQLADEALAITTRHKYQRLLPEVEHIRDSIPAGEE